MFASKAEGSLDVSNQSVHGEMIVEKRRSGAKLSRVMMKLELQ